MFEGYSILVGRRAYFIYSTHATREAAQWALEDYLASDIVSEAEHPRIERMAPSRFDPRGHRFCVLFPAE